MDWKIVSNTQDLMLLEKRRKELSIRIEARLNKEKSWDIYKIYFNKKTPNFVEEYKAQSASEAKRLVESLKAGKDLTLKQIENIRSEEGYIKVKRRFNEFNVEKWKIEYNNTNAGMFFIRYFDPISLDIVLNEQYKPFEQNILNEIFSTLGINSQVDDVNHTIYYFTRKSIGAPKKDEKKKFVLGKIEFGISRERL